MVADPKALQILVAVELFIVGVGHLRELCFVLFIKDSHGVATEIGPRHGNDVSLGLRHERMDCLAHDVRIIGRRMVELVNGNNGLIKLVRQLDLLKGKAEGRMRADQVMRVRVLHELHDLIDLAGIARRTQVVLRIHMPVGEEAECRQVGVLKGTADGHFRHSHNDLLQALLHHLVERQKHQCTGLTGSRRRLDEQILRIALFIGSGLHLTHAKRIVCRTLARTGIAGSQNVCHFFFPFLAVSFFVAAASFSYFSKSI